ncbi:hypothetical protein HPP92_026517 [Vanilla planifolia]|uniref:Uncharacterized protein n=1 Tax=Vanilla planifolia TaxID=51239 RepID=A0A835PD67_VANPL|nr:hypothetical protein HPP92_026745 [Vanilla planifolia]KAG0450859.1 hypothetical protein HPP92_026517 [Vanilla planifolia]
MGRAPCCDKSTVKKGPWSPEEDSKLKQFIEQFGTGGNWIALPHKAGLKRCGKSCRLRWLNYLRPNIKHGEFSDAEDRIICSLFASIGSRWSIIASQLPGRTDNDIKNYWNTKLKKKLLGISSSSQKKASFLQYPPLLFPSASPPAQPINASFGSTLPASSFHGPFLSGMTPESLTSSTSSSSSISHTFPNHVKLESGSSALLSSSDLLRFNDSLLGETGLEGLGGVWSSSIGYDDIRHPLFLNGDGEVLLEGEDGSTGCRGQWRSVGSSF